MLGVGPAAVHRQPAPDDRLPHRRDLGRRKRRRRHRSAHSGPGGEGHSPLDSLHLVRDLSTGGGNRSAPTASPAAGGADCLSGPPTARNHRRLRERAFGGANCTDVQNVCRCEAQLETHRLCVFSKPPNDSANSRSARRSTNGHCAAGCRDSEEGQRRTEAAAAHRASGGTAGGRGERVC